MVPGASLREALDHSRLALADIKELDKTTAKIYTNLLTKQKRETKLIISGPQEVLKGTSCMFEIVGYDKDSHYIVSATAGVITRFGSIIAYIAPSEQQQVVISVNGINHCLSVIDETKMSSIVKVNKPLLNHSLAGSSISITASRFTMSNGKDIHRSTDWQLAVDPEFNKIVYSSMDNIIHKTTWSINNLAPDIKYYIRARYKGTEQGYSDWSETTEFTPKSIYIPSSHETTLITDDAAPMDLLGVSVSMNGNGTKIVVGAHGATISNLSEAGKAYVFSLENGRWIQEAILIASDKATNNCFGHSVAIDTTGKRIVIGAYGADHGDKRLTGKAYIFFKSISGWVQEAILTASDSQAGDGFGFSTAISGNGDVVAVGACLANTGGAPMAGKVYIFSKYLQNSKEQWILTGILVGTNKEADDKFGWSVALAKDGSRVVIGASSANFEGELSVGKAYVFRKLNMEWSIEAALVSDDRSPGDHFGWSIASNDDCSIIAVSAPYARFGRNKQAGKVYVFSRVDKAWHQEMSLDSGSELSSKDRFGSSVSLNGCGDRLAVGASHADVDNLPETGKFYIYVRTNAEWVRKTIHTAKDKEPTDLFGSCLCFDNRGRRLVVTSPLANGKDNIKSSGKLYIYS